MDPNGKLSLKRRVQRSIRRRKPKAFFWYLIAAVLLIGVCVLLKLFPLDAKAVAYDGIAGTGAFTATFTGNINCVGDGATIDAKGYAEYFDGVRELFSKTDYLSVAINDPILDDHVETYESGMSIKFTDKYFNTDFAPVLYELGVKDAALCNKTIFRYGSKGALETSRALEFEDINVAGLRTSNNIDAAVRSEYFDGTRTIMHVDIEASDDRARDYSDYDIRTYNDRDDNIIRDITNLRQQNPDAFIVATVSWAEHYLLKPSTYMKNLCHTLIDCGADVVVGSGIQMVLSAEKYNGSYIFYGLGNLVADEAYTMTQRGAVLNCVFDDNGAVSYELVPLSVKNGRPKLSGSKLVLHTLVSDLGKDAEYSIQNGTLILK